MDSINLLARKSASCADLLTCLYNLKPADIETLLAVAKNPGATLDEIARIVQKDRSSVHRILSKLVSINLLNKQSKSLKGGGYYHTYTIVEPSLIKNHAKQQVEEIIKSLETLIDHFEIDFKKHLEAS